MTDRDAAVRREAAIAARPAGRTGCRPALYAALGESDAFAAWSIRQAIRRLNAWDKQALVEALLDERRLESAPAAHRRGLGGSRRRGIDRGARSHDFGSREEPGSWPTSPVLYRRYPEWSGQWFGTNPLAGPFPQKTAEWSAEGMKGVEQGLSLALADRDRAVRFQAIVGLTEVGPTAAHLLAGSSHQRAGSR